MTNPLLKSSKKFDIFDFIQNRTLKNFPKISHIESREQTYFEGQRDWELGI